MPAAACRVTKHKDTKPQPLEMRDVLVSMNLTTHVLEMRGAGWERAGGGFPWGELCLKFNMLFLSLNAPATLLPPLSFSFVICLADEISYLPGRLSSLNGPCPSHTAPHSVTQCYRSQVPSRDLRFHEACPFAP